MRSTRRFVTVLAGTQGGKTSLEPWWLEREIRYCGAGDYLAVTATFDLFGMKFLPLMLECFEHVLGWGRYWASKRVLELSDPLTGQFLAKRADDDMWARILLRSADSSTGLESSSAKAALLDEAGLDTYTLGTWQAIQRRLSLSQGRVFLGTTLYNPATWIKRELYTPWTAGDPTIDVIQFDSALNPAFPKEEQMRMRGKMPTHTYNMFYRGRFDTPAGLIYDAFTDAMICPPFAIPDTWPRYLGLDFGGVNTAAVYLAEDPAGPPGGRVVYAYREYLAGGRTASEHAAALRAGEPRTPDCVGGSRSEGQWRREFAAGGLGVQPPPISDVDLGITRVYGLIKRNRLRVFSSCTGTIGQLQSYARVVDASGEPTPEIADKATYHYLDALRYVCAWYDRAGSIGV